MRKNLNNERRNVILRILLLLYLLCYYIRDKCHSKYPYLQLRLTGAGLRVKDPFPLNYLVMHFSAIQPQLQLQLLP